MQMEHLISQEEPDLQPAERDVQRIELHVNTVSNGGGGGGGGG